MIAKTMLVGLVAGCLNLVAAAPAQAEEPVAGRLCGFMLSDVHNSETQVVEISGGPLAAAQGATISMACTLQIGGANWRHSGADAVSVASSPSPQVTAIPPATTMAAVPYDAALFYCTQATVDGVTYYWDSWYGVWSTDDGAPCDETICQESGGRSSCPPCCGGGPLAPLTDFADSLTGDADPVVCPVLGTLAPGVPGVAVEPEGDVSLSPYWEAWNCTPSGGSGP